MSQANFEAKIANSVRETLNQLGGFPVEPPDTIIPLKVRPLFTTLKHEIRDLLLSKMNDRTTYRSSAENLRSRVLSDLAKAGVVVGESAKDQAEVKGQQSQKFFYNDIKQISIERPAGHLDLLIATTTLGVMCGEDTSLYSENAVVRESDLNEGTGRTLGILLRVWGKMGQLAASKRRDGK